MSNKLAIEVLQNRRAELVKEREKIWTEIGKKILEIDEALSGLGEYVPVEPEHKFIYDDESPDYIKQSIEA